MNICVLSMQKIDNYGSLLQAYALKKIVENFGNEVFFLDIEKIDSDFELMSNKLNYDDEIDKKGINISKFDKYICNRAKNKLLSNFFTKSCNDFRIKELDIMKTLEKYDVCIIGSDEVFNCMNAGWWGFTSQLFGNITVAKTIVTYAASCGATKYENLNELIINKISCSFKKISAFSARDQNTYSFIRHFIDSDVVINLDPVLIYDFQNELKNVRLPILPHKYCVIYSYGNRIKNENEIKSILQFCKKHNMVPVAVGGCQFWCKNYLPSSPFECLKIINNSAYVITDTFHGTIFSIKYARKFAIITRDSNFNKLNDLVYRMKIEKHLIKDMSQLEKVYSMEKEQDSINTIINQERERTFNYLRTYINGTK